MIMSPVEKSVLDGLSKGILAELSAYVFYKKCLNLSKDKRIVDILSKLAADEKDHYRILEGQYDNLVRSEMWVTYNDILNKSGLPDIDEKTEDIHDKLIDQVDTNSTPLQMLQIALILEERARDLYADLAKKVTDPKGKDTYEFLAKFESGHVAKVKVMMEDFK
jgi:rubrerythrin